MGRLQGRGREGQDRGAVHQRAPARQPEVFKGRTLTYSGRWIYKYEEAARQGALGCLIIHTTPTAGYGWEVVRNSWSKEDPQVKLEPGANALAFAGWVTQEAGEKLLALSGHTVDELLQAADSRDFRPIPLGVPFAATCRRRSAQIESRNVLGMIPGSDPKLRDRVCDLQRALGSPGYGAPGERRCASTTAQSTTPPACGVVLERRAPSARCGRRRGDRSCSHFGRRRKAACAERNTTRIIRCSRLAKTAVEHQLRRAVPFGRTRDVVVSARSAQVYGRWFRRRRSGMNSRSRRIHGRSRAATTDRIISCWRGSEFLRFVSDWERKISGKPDNFADAEFTEYNAKRYHQPSDEFREDWDFASLEHAARYGFTIGLNVANQESTAPLECGR